MMRPLRVVVLALTLAASLVTATPGAPPADATNHLTLASRYGVQRIDSPEAVQDGNLAWLGLANAGDLDDDGADDILVPQYNGTGTIFAISGDDGSLIHTLRFPDAATSAPGSDGNFVYPAKVADLGSCPGRDENDLCPNPIGDRDQVPEILVGAPGADVETPGGPAIDVGRAYVFDGATGALMKKIQMPAADIDYERTNFPSGKSFGFGRGVVSPYSNFAPPGSAAGIGDLDGDTFADFVVGNPTYFEQGPATNPSCSPGPCPGAGRVFFFGGGDIADSDPTVVLDAPLEVVKNPMAQTGSEHERFGHAIIPVGDVGGCTSDPGPGVACPSVSNVEDGRPDVVVAAHQTEQPAGYPSSGVVTLFDGPTGAILRTYPHPQPQVGALFGYSVGTMSTAIGDVGDTTHADIFVPAVLQDIDKVGQGRGYIFTGNPRTSFSNVLWAQVDDPTPHRGENFGAPWAGVGDVAGDPRNEVLVGTAGPWVPGDNREIIGDVHVLDPLTGSALLTLTDPDRQAGSGFGQGVAQLGDLNVDGFMDFAVAAGFYTGTAGAEQGRLYIFRSDEAAPASTIVRPANGGSYERSRLDRFRGTATDGDGGSGVAGVEIALRQRRTDGSCRWWNGSRFVSRRCGAELWVDAEGTETWRYDLPSALPRSVRTGVRDYALISRATDDAGNAEAAFDAGRNRNRFEVR